MYARGSSRLVYGPHENHRVTSASLARSRRAGASSAVGGRSVSVGPCSAMLALLYDIHGNLPALEAVLDDTAGRGVDRWLLGGDMAPFGAWPGETVQRLRDLENAEWIRGNTERWMVDPIPAVEPMSVAVQACRDALGYAVADELGALPESAALANDRQGVARLPGLRHAVVPARAGRRRGRAADRGHGRAAVLRPHPPAVPPHRAGPNGPVELVNPGSIGIPLDGDHRAAYALVGDDGAIEFRRVEYDWQASADALRERYGDPEWVGIVTGRIERAKLNAG